MRINSPRATLPTLVTRGVRLRNTLGATAYQRILFAVDGGHASYLALHQTIVVGKAMGVGVGAFFVADNSNITSDMVGSDSIVYAKQVAGHGRNTLAKVSEKPNAAGIEHSTKLLENSIVSGQVSTTVVAEANETATDLIVLGTYGQRGLKHLVFSSVVEDMVRRTNKPILMMHSEAEG